MALGGRRLSSRPRKGRDREPEDADGHTRDGLPRDAAIAPDADPESTARTACLDMLSTRARSRAELADALTRRGFPADVVETVLDRLVEVRLIDDAAFAEQWVDSRHRHRGLGRRALADELRRKGVDNETAGVALAELGQDDERARARDLVDKRLPSLARFETAVATRRLVGMLARKGYGGGLAYEVVREAMAERDIAIDDADVDPGD